MHNAKGKLLYIAPESNMAYFKSLKNLQITTSDFNDTCADLKIDITHTSFNDDSWDFIVCHHVLEHIADDKKAMRELSRIINKNGKVIISVPIDSNLNKSIKYESPNSLEYNHYHRYGIDFSESLAEFFFIKEYIFSEIFSEKEFKSLCLTDECIFVCQKK